MRVFLCPYGGFSLAIPMDSVLSVILNQKRFKKIVDFNPHNSNTYISLPIFLNCGDRELRHGIVLKDGDDERLENKIVLLTYEIESEIELAQNKIFPMPGTLSAMKFSQFILGLVFSNHHNREKTELILLLNPDHIVQYIKKEYKA